MNEDGVVGSSGCTHDSPLVDILDISSLKGESVDDDGEVGYLSAVFLEPFWTFDGIGSFILVETVSEVFDGGLTAGSNGVEVGTVFSLLRRESFRKSTIPSCFGCGQGLIDTFLGIVSFFSQGGDEGLVSIFVVNGVSQFVDSRASDVLGQGSNSFGGELIFPVVDEGEGALRIDDGDFRQLQNFGRHLEVNWGSKHFPVFEHVIGRR